MRFLDCFAGVGGFSLGLEWAGWTVAGQIEVDPYCRRVLSRHWPGVWQRGDIRLVSGEDVRDGCGDVDAIVGGFPCQPVSCAGKQRGEADRRWLWPELLRLVCELRPGWVLAENVPGLRTRGADRVCANLEAAGYAVRSLVVGAWAVGAPHRRERVWIIARQLADAGHERVGNRQHGGEHRERAALNGRGPGVGFSESSGRTQGNGSQEAARRDAEPCGAGAGVGHANGTGLEGRGVRGGERADERAPRAAGGAAGMADANGAALRDESGRCSGTDGAGAAVARAVHRWPARPGEAQHPWEFPRTVESRVGRATHGPARRLALKGLGNMAMPAVVEAVGRAVLAVEAA